ncbi:MAG: hypothetical protein HC880_17765 [Bacteroidia bacterium]|nr:hypothetical protein [Bacteroidia bacterium]
MLALSLHQYAVFCQPGITFDSRNYLTAAQSYAQEGVFRMADGRAFDAYPPLYPWLLSHFSPNLLSAVRGLNALFLTLSLSFYGYLSTRWIGAKPLRIMYLMSLLLATPPLFDTQFCLVRAFVYDISKFFILLLGKVLAQTCRASFVWAEPQRLTTLPDT